MATIYELDHCELCDATITPETQLDPTQELCNCCYQDSREEASFEQQTRAWE